MTSDASELSAIAQAVRTIMKGFDPEYWMTIDQQKSFPSKFFQTMGDAGYFGTLIPEAWGGTDAGPAAASVIVEEINRAGGDAAAVNAQMSICGTIVRHGSDEQRALLPEIAAGKLRCLSVAATEADSGADMTDLQSSAVRDGDDWVITAKKMFISMAEHTDLVMVLVATAEGPTLFLLRPEQASDHLEVRPLPMIVNRMTTTFFVDGARAPSSAMVGAPGQGLKCLMGGFAPRRILAAAEAIGNARFMLDKSLAHAKERETFGRTIGENQGVQYPLAQAYAKVEAAALMRADALRLLLAGEEAGGRSALAKILSSEAAWETARAAMTTFGGWALSSEMHIERKLRESTVFVFNNMLLTYVAQRVLGLPKAF